MANVLYFQLPMKPLSKIVTVCVLGVLLTWLSYWAGYWAGYVSHMRSEYITTVGSILYDIKLLKDLNADPAGSPAVEQGLRTSIESRLTLLSALDSVILDEHFYLRQFGQAFYQTPRMAYVLEERRSEAKLPTLSELQEKYQRTKGAAKP